MTTMSDANETMKSKLRGLIGSQRQEENAAFGERVRQDNEASARARESRLRDLLDQAGYHDTYRTAADRYSLYHAAKARVQAEERQTLEEERRQKHSDLVQRHLESYSKEAELAELRREVKAKGEASIQDRIRFQYLTAFARSKGHEVDPL